MLIEHGVRIAFTDADRPGHGERNDGVFVFRQAEELGEVLLVGDLPAAVPLEQRGELQRQFPLA